MKKLKFKCKLLTDIILNVKSASEGPNETLDFIPGNNFLGIAASQLYNNDNIDLIMEIFHSGHVRFGDAHPAVDVNSDVRTLKIPSVLFYPKLGSLTNKCYVSFATDMQSEIVRHEQPKQCRKGFYDMFSEHAVKSETGTNFAIKSAYDRDSRRSKDGCMFGYESLRKGLVMMFDVEIDHDEYLGKNISSLLIRTLEGEHRVGRSKSAQYGLVSIKSADFKECGSGEDAKNQVTVYADGRLIFLDENGLPTFQPSSKQLGIDIDGAIVDWAKSQVRTFQYSPWNSKRQCFDTDRCGIEKGSVFIVNLPEGKLFSHESCYIGSYNNEGFGKVIYNPLFLNSKINGESVLTFVNPSKENSPANCKTISTTLVKYLEAQKHDAETEADVFRKVRHFEERYGSSFENESFASQWGTIRSIAMKCSTKKELVKELYDNVVTEKYFDKNGNEKSRQRNMAYLTHGVAEKKWNRDRLQCIKNFVEELNDGNAQMAVICLASVMAKKCRRK